MSYNIENLKKLRLLTGVGIRECMGALSASGGNLPRALEWLKENSLLSSKSAKSGAGEKLNKHGLVKIGNARNKIIVFSLKCESDFVAANSVFTKLADDITTLLLEKFTTLANYSQEQLNEELRALISLASYSLNEKIYAEKVSFFSKEETEVFGQYTHHNAKVGAFVVTSKGSEKIARELAMQAVANSPVFLAAEDIPQEMISSKLGEIRQLVSSENVGREPVIIERIISGMFNKWISEVCFLEQHDFRNPSRKVKQVADDGNTDVKQLFLISIDN